MKYISLFSGIGGFEIAINRIFSKAECIGYSEVDSFAIKVYKHHFPTHTNLGSVLDITEDQIKKLVKKHKGCDLIVGGFPCQNLSSLAKLNGNADGLEGPKSSLFYNMLNIIDWIQKYNPKKVQLHLLAENNNSMTNANKKLITDTFQEHFKIPIYRTMLNGADFGVQTRRRLYWTTFNVSTTDKPIKCEQTWDDILEPIENCNNYKVSEKYLNNTYNKIYYNTPSEYALICIPYNDGYIFEKIKNNNKLGKTRWQNCSFHSDTSSIKSRTITTHSNSISNCIFDRRISNNGKYFMVRYFIPIEIERLFWLSEGWVSDLCSKTRCSKLLGNTVVVKVIEYILGFY